MDFLSFCDFHQKSRNFKLGEIIITGVLDPKLLAWIQIHVNITCFMFLRSKVLFSLEKFSFLVKNCDFGVKNESLFDHLAWNFRSKTGFDQLHFEFRIFKIPNMNFVLNFWVLSENRPRWWIGRPFRNSSIWKFYGNFDNFCQFSEYFAIFPNWIKFWIF